MQKSTGLVVVTGNGKGKTTTALGYVTRALALGKKVCMIQFLKGGGFSGELFVTEKFSGRFCIEQFGGSYSKAEKVKTGEIKLDGIGECFKESRNPKNDWAGQALNEAVLHSKKDYDVFVLDEVAHAINRNLVSLKDVKELVDNIKDKMLVILTGRNMPKDFIVIADTAIECFPLKHPKSQGIKSRRGIEY